ncbi:HAMP domain-containing histidine kinase [Rhodococcus antarcticus]|uniref:histidine kinase n=1 Tax=Rhodococcus antarcticus TaxID=2987751 RepID=A0ABY6P3S8_9NOCA|nr:HAMP domain-containing sensor histidine kinase [Rhodococcus antarcticus]UZJ25916.1 HAMP domain-containing histidine kinase [Rhodococcus antarcticus]
MSRPSLGLRLRLTALATVVVALAGALLLVLGWVLAGQVANDLPVSAGAPVVVDGVVTDSGVLAATLRAQAQSAVLSRGALAYPLVVVAAALVSWVLTGRALRPLHRVTATARRLSQESLDERIRLDGPRDEVRELAETFDTMLDRLQAAFDAQQRFVADASHELRTPLAVMRTEVDVTLADPDADVAELRRMGEVLRAATDRAEAMVAGLLVVARSRASGLDVHEPVDVAELVPGALAAVAGEVRGRDLRVGTELAPLHTVGDPALLDRVVGNLVENAVRHNSDGGWLHVRTGAPGLVVSSSGAVVGDVAALFEPFHRGGPGRTGHRGSGLGLAIVSAVVAAHGGTVHAEPVEGGGLTVTVVLPAP